MVILTKKSKDKLLNYQFIGTGSIVVKTNHNEFETIDFWLGNKGTFYVVGNSGKPQQLSDYLCTLGNELKDREYLSKVE